MKRTLSEKENCNTTRILESEAFKRHNTLPDIDAHDTSSKSNDFSARLSAFDFTPKPARNVPPGNLCIINQSPLTLNSTCASSSIEYGAPCIDTPQITHSNSDSSMRHYSLEWRQKKNSKPCSKLLSTSLETRRICDFYSQRMITMLLVIMSMIFFILITYISIVITNDVITGKCWSEKSSDEQTFFSGSSFDNSSHKKLFCNDDAQILITARYFSPLDKIALKQFNIKSIGVQLPKQHNSWFSNIYKGLYSFWLGIYMSLYNRYTLNYSNAQNQVSSVHERINNYINSGILNHSLQHSRASQLLKRHSLEFTKRIEHVAYNVYVAIGYGLANVVLIESKTGLLIIDTLENRRAMEAVKVDWINYKNLNNSFPTVHAIFYSHFHSDHVFGSAAVYTPGITQVWAHVDTETIISGVTYKRSMRQFGSLLSEEQGFLNAGIGPKLLYSAKEADDDNLYVVTPTHVWSGNTKVLEIDGELLHLIKAPGESKDQIIIWLPDKRILFGADNIYKSFPNIYAIRGTETRDTMAWVRSLDTMRFLKPDYMVLGHTSPLIGKKKILETLTAYRDAVQYIHDQTVRHMNKGHSIDDIIEIVKLPPPLSEHPFLIEHYGTVAWAVRAVFQHYVGWFSGQAEQLNSLGSLERAEKMANLVGGNENLLVKAVDALEKKDFQWALELATHSTKLNSKCPVARKLRALILRRIAAEQLSAPARNWYLTAANEEEDFFYKEKNKAWLTNLFKLNRRQNDSVSFTKQLKLTNSQRRSCIKSLTNITDSFDFIPVRVKAESFTSNIDMAIFFRFTDDKFQETVVCLHLRQGLAHVSPKCDRNADINVVTSDKTWRKIITQELHPLVAVTTGGLRITGGDPWDYWRLKQVLHLVEFEME